MRKSVIVAALVLVAAVAGALYLGGGSAQPATSANPQPSFGGRGGSMIGRVPMTVELYKVARAPLNEKIMVVGNLTGAATVDVAPKTSGRLQSIAVRIGDPVRQGQPLARIEDREIQEQVKQAEASYAVSEATIRQRQADLQFAQTNAERSRNLYSRQLISKQTLDDTDSRLAAAQAQLDLAKAQFQQSSARLEELRINLGNTIITSPVDGFVGKRNFDPGAWVGPNAPVASVVDIHFVRLIANLVEKDLRRVAAGKPAAVEVDAYPGEVFEGRIARVAPVLDPATRTAQMEVEVPNPQGRLKPGMYARVNITVDERASALVVPRAAVIDMGGRRGVFVPVERTAQFRPIQVGLQATDLVEVINGVSEGEAIITTGAAALKDGDRILLPGQSDTPGASPAGGRAKGKGKGGQGRGGQGQGRGQ